MRRILSSTLRLCTNRDILLNPFHVVIELLNAFINHQSTIMNMLTYKSCEKKSTIFMLASEKIVAMHNINLVVCYRYSETCTPMDDVVNPLKDEFIRVICQSKYFPWSMDVVYRNFHAVPLPNRSSKTLEKIFYWSNHTNPSHDELNHVNEQNKLSPERKNKTYVDVSTSTPENVDSSILKLKKYNHHHPSQTDNLHTKEPKSSQEKKELHKVPPNVVLLGIDSMSRLSFQRNMKKTRKYLQEIGAVEMLGYTKGINRNL